MRHALVWPSGQDWADAGYAGTLVDWVKALRPRGSLHLDIVRRSDDAKGFQVLRRRWIVERTSMSFVKQRRRVRDYEAQTQHSEALLYITMIPLVVRRLARSKAQ